MRLLNLAADCRAAGLEVVEVAGWQSRGSDLGNVGAVIAHHTAVGPASSDAAVDRLLRDGRPASGDRPALPGPLSQLGLDRHGRVRLIAAGKANHAGRGSWRGIEGNSRAVGVEAYNDGRGEQWPQAQLDAWDVLNVVLLRTCDLPADAICGHREWTPRKIDPYGLDMAAMRARARYLLAPPAPPRLTEGPDMLLVLSPTDSRQYLCDRDGASPVGGYELAALLAAGVPALDAKTHPDVRREMLVRRGVTL